MKTRRVTQADVTNAAIIAQILSAKPDTELCCIKALRHECPNCHCEVACGHRDPEECVARAIGARAVALDLFHAMEDQISDWAINSQGRNEWFDDMVDEGYVAYVEACRAFRAGIGLDGDADFVDDPIPEAAQLLADGLLPPGWRLVK